MNTSINASTGDTRQQNFITFVSQLESKSFDFILCFEFNPTGQDIVNAIASESKNPLLYKWTTNSLI